MMLAWPQVVGAHTQEGALRWESLPAPWLLVVIGVGTFLYARSVMQRDTGRLSPGRRLLLAALRTLAIWGVLLALFAPFRESTTTAQEKAHLVVLVDTSASMAIRDGYPESERAALAELVRPLGAEADPSAPARGELVRGLLASPGETMLRAWADRFVLDVFAFDGDWHSLGSTRTRAGDTVRDEPESGGTGGGASDALTELGEAIRATRSEGGRTAIGPVLRRVANEFARRPDQDLAGVVLLSDGRDTSDGESPQQVLASLEGVEAELRVIAVGMGNRATGRNVWLEHVRADDVVLVRDEVLFETAVRHEGFEGSPADVRIEIERIADPSGKELPTPEPYRIRSGWESNLEVAIDALGSADSEGAPVRVRLPFDEAGIFRVRTRVELRDGADRRDDRIPDDDVREHRIRVTDQRIKVLYVDKWPRYDWRFLSTYLTREPDPRLTRGNEDARSRFQVHVLLQSADPSYRQPASFGETAIRSFPRTRAELFAYDVIMLGDIEWSRLDPSGRTGSEALLRRLVEFVEEGGGLALQAGVDYRNPLDFLGTPLSQLLPVHASEQDRTFSNRTNHAFRLQLTPAGLEHPMFSVVPGSRGTVPTRAEIESTWLGQSRLSEDWMWRWMYRPRGGLKPGATALARVHAPSDESFRDRREQPLAVFALMPFGRGRVFWCGLDYTARVRRGVRDMVFGPFWEQVLRDLATYRLLNGNKRYKIVTDKERYFVGETANVTIRALDPNFEPLKDPFLDGVHVELITPRGRVTEGIFSGDVLVGDERPQSLQAEGAEGSYRLTFPLTRSGTVRVSIDREEVTAGRRSTERADHSFEVLFRAREDAEKIPDHETLATIVRATNPGQSDARVLAPTELAGAIEELPARPRERVLERRERPLWDRWWVLVGIVALLALEWALRKRWHMV